MTTQVQRWLFRRDRYRPAGEVINTAAFDVAPIDGDAIAKAFVTDHHYAHSYPAARERLGLYERGELVGVAVFSVPASAAVLTNVFPWELRASLELGRFVLLDSVPGNGETWFLARCFEHLRTKAYRGVVSFSDPVPRDTSDGRRIFPGHIGTIYQAHNARYIGRGTARTLRLFPDGTVFSPRAIQKIRSGDRGWRYAAGQLETWGARPAPDDDGDRREWLAHELRRLTRPMKHPGNHKYAWTLQREGTIVPASQAYPKAS